MMQVEPALAVVQPVAPLFANVKFVVLLPPMEFTVEEQPVPDAVKVKVEQVLEAS
jgi:hypothetical protein